MKRFSPSSHGGLISVGAADGSFIRPTMHADLIVMGPDEGGALRRVRFGGRVPSSR
jgi:hypothetical protein